MRFNRVYALALLFLVGVALAIDPGSATAQPYSSKVTGVDGTPTPTQESGGEHQIYENVNRIYKAAGVGIEFKNNQALDKYYSSPDTQWQNLSGTISLIGIAAGDSNTFGVYTNSDGSGQTSLFTQSGSQAFQGAGTAGDPFAAKTTSAGKSTPVGFFLKDTSTSKTYYSDSALNHDGYDHMFTYQLTDLIGKTIYVNTGSGPQAITLQNPYLIAWEDRPIPGADEDYNDMVLLVDKVAAVPVPASFVLFGLGFGGLSLSALRRRLRALRALAAA